MADAIARRNEKARVRAQAAGLVTYQHEVVDLWPACVVCGKPIRHRGDRSIYRGCGCDGRRWRCSVGGDYSWVRVEEQ